MPTLQSFMPTQSEHVTKTLASVVIPTKNPGPLFLQVLAMVMRQKTSWPFEVIVIDSGSRDGTLEAVRQDFPAVRLVEIAPESFGHGRTRNQGVSLAKGEFVALITHDALPVDENWLEGMVAPLLKDPEVAGVFGRHLPYPHAGPFVKRDITQHFDHLASWPNPLWLEDRERYDRDQGYRQVLHFFSDNNACLRKSVWQDIPYPDVNFAEDQIWAKTIIEAGYKKAYANEAMVYHSHDYSVIELFRRSFDESTALFRLFGYTLCPSLLQAIKGVVRGSLHNWSYLKDQTVERRLYWMCRVPFNEMARQFGHFLGSAPRSERLYQVLSLDHSLKTARTPSHGQPS